MPDIYTKVPHVEYMRLLKRCETLERDVIVLKTELKKAQAAKIAVSATPKTETKTETKKGGNKE